MPGSACNRESSPGLRDRFDPESWHRVYAHDERGSEGYLFQRVTEEVGRAARPLIVPDQLWLDLGCGTGELCRQLAGCGARLLGVDHDPSMLQWASTHVVSTLPVGLVAAEVTRIPCGDRTVDGVVAASLTGCLEDLDPFIAELSRILVHGGYAVLSFTNGDSLLLALSSGKQRSAQGIESPCHGRFHRYQLDEVLRTASRYGFGLVVAKHFNCFADLSSRAFPPIGLARLLEKCPVNLIQRRLCRNLVLVLRR